MRQAAVLLLAVLVAVPLVALAPAAADDAPPVLHAEIVRDLWGVPHVYANDAYSLFYANGYAQAQDRLAQMEILRHVGRGELAKLTGPSGLELDLVTRRELYTHEERVAAFEALPPEWRAAFQAYADGVNRWIDEVRADPAKLPVEYPALAVLPEPWQVTDTIAIAQYLLDVFGRGSGGGEVEAAKLLARLSGVLDPGHAGAFSCAGAVQGAFADHHWVRRTGENTTYTTIKAEDGVVWEPLPAETRRDLCALEAQQAEATAAALAAEPVDDAASTLAEASAEAGFPIRLGSNAQLVSGAHTASGRPILFGGPQMGYFTPMIPYEIGLHGAGFDAVGMGVAGAPGVIIGRVANVSWTVTSGASDQVDTVAEKLVPGNPRQYFVDGEVRDMDCRIETHLVRPGPADFVPDADPDWRPPLFDVVEQEVCRTVHGPVLFRTPDGAYAFASNRSYRGDEVRSGTLWLQIGTIRSLADFEDLFSTFKFTFNFNFATEDGHIAYYHVGAQPLRDTRLDPRLPRPGWDSTYEWEGFAHLADLPHVVDPPTGYTVNWNNAPHPSWSSGDARELWGAIHRAERMAEELVPLVERGGITLDDVRAANVRASTTEPYADDLFPLLEGAAAAVGDPAVEDALAAWRAADFTYADADQDGFHDHAAFRLYELWRERLQRLVFEDELGDRTRLLAWDPPTSGDPHAADHGDHGNKDNVLVDTLAGRSARDWCDDAGTPAAESCHAQALAALQAALAVQACDGETCVPEWSAPFPTRQIRFVPLGAGPAYRIDMVNKPSFQHFYDWGLPESAERSRNALPPGASGHLPAADFVLLQFHRGGCAPCPVPPHLEDQLGMYERFEDKPLIYSRAVLGPRTESVTTLVG